MDPLHVLSSITANDPVLTATCLGTALYTGLLVTPAFTTSHTAMLFVVFATVIFPVAFMLISVYGGVLGSVSKDDQYWTKGLYWHGPKGNHDFCEENYRYTSHVAEFHNTWSSLPFVFFGAAGTYLTRRYATDEMRFQAAFISIGFIGVGSALFHGTLLRWGQIMDEAPMMFYVFCALYCFIEDGPKPRYGTWLPILLASSCVLFVVYYLVFYVYWIFLVGFISGVVILVGLGAVKSLQSDTSPMACYLYQGATLSIFLGAVCWIIDDSFCSYVVEARLHIGWHIFTSLSAYLFIMSLVAVRGTPLQKETILVYPNILAMLKFVINKDDGQKFGLEMRAKDGKLSTVPRASPPLFLPYVQFS